MELKSTYEENEILLKEIETLARNRGVKLSEYTLGIVYSPTIGSGLGYVIDESHLEPQPIYITAETWQESASLGLPINEALELVVDHELIHEVHRSRAQRKLTWPVSTEALESITHGIQLRPEYVAAKAQRLSFATIEWLARKSQGVRKKFYDPLVQLASSPKVPAHIAEVYGGIVQEIDKEVSDDEYLEALGI